MLCCLGQLRRAGCLEVRGRGKLRIMANRNWRKLMTNQTEPARKHFDFWSIIVIGVTLILFIVALFIKGLTHDLLLEAGVFLVSVKLILMSYKNSVHAVEMEERLEQIYDLLRALGNSSHLPEAGD
jgi:hypothetical protein